MIEATLPATWNFGIQIIPRHGFWSVMVSQSLISRLEFWVRSPDPLQASGPATSIWPPARKWQSYLRNFQAPFLAMRPTTVGS